MELPAILKEENVEAAAELLRRYYLEPSTKTGLLSTGSYFDEWANRGDNPEVRDRITDSDAVAVSMLSVKVPAQAIIGLQEKLLAANIRDLLADIPTDVKMSDLTVAEAEATLGEGSPSWLLWQELRRTPKNALGCRGHHSQQDHGEEATASHPHLGQSHRGSRGQRHL
ncbi:DUF6308 family protein [Pseudarthrobacter sp. NPDC092184]|uniref:DUF6308 family protein n=1 Tax=unclassified Pseudarthrobacter TaxID=2647000 RepID=UPI0037F430A3